MKQLKNSVAIKISVILFLFGINSLFVAAQRIGITNEVTTEKRHVRGSNNSTPKSSSTNRNNVLSPPTVKKIYVPKVEYRNITGLTIATLPKTTILLESVGAKKQINRNGVTNEDGILSFELQPGKYKITSSLEGYQAEESEVAIEPHKMSTVRFELEQTKYNFPVLIKGNNSKNIVAGEVLYAPVKVLEEKSNDTSKVEFKGGFCMVPITNGKAEIKGLPEGSYYFDVRADEVEYKPEKAIIKIPEDIISEETEESNKPDEIKPIEVELERKHSTVTFSQMVADAWEHPPKWSINNKGIKAEGLGIALPKDESFRYYKDFQMMSSSMRLLNDGSVGFILRAVDDKNYYLIQLNGKNSLAPNKIQAFIVENGKIKEKILDNPIPVPQFFDNQKRFSVIITAKGNIFEVEVVNSMGDSLSLGKVNFENNNFPIGAVGIKSTAEDSIFDIGFFTVCNERC